MIKSKILFMLLIKIYKLKCLNKRLSKKLSLNMKTYPFISEYINRLEGELKKSNDAINDIKRVLDRDCLITTTEYAVMDVVKSYLKNRRENGKNRI